MMHFLLHTSVMSMQLGLLLLRVGIGLISIKIGIDALFNGAAGLESLGASLTIYHPLLLWGMIVACMEVILGFFLTVGLGTRLAGIVQGLIMAIMTAHVTSQAGSLGVSYHLILMVCAFVITLAGPGKLSCDEYWYTKASMKKQNSDNIDTLHRV
jgi:uncharacterized membrane protein YphA (DoxX/SURF4 family)